MKFIFLILVSVLTVLSGSSAIAINDYSEDTAQNKIIIKSSDVLNKTENQNTKTKTNADICCTAPKKVQPTKTKTPKKQESRKSASLVDNTSKSGSSIFNKIGLGREKLTNDEFLSYFSTKLNKVFKEVKAERGQLERYIKKIREAKPLKPLEKQNLYKIAEKYEVFEFSETNADQLIELHKRVNVVPTSLAMAQAVVESGWGNSRFAKLGNNYFGQQCYIRGCGIVPLRRDIGKVHEVRKFKTPEESIREYLLNLNTHKAYTEFREARYKMRSRMRGTRLAEFLTKYSELEEEYPAIIVKTIKDFDLEKN
jgi:Bax protein